MSLINIKDIKTLKSFAADNRQTYLSKFRRKVHFENLSQKETKSWDLFYVQEG